MTRQPIRRPAGVKPLLARVSADPLETFIGALSVVSAVSYELGAPPPGSLDASLPHWFLRVWGGFLFVGGVAVLTGVFTRWRAPFAQGLILLAAGLVVYSIAILGGRLPGSALQGGTDIALAAVLTVRGLRRPVARR